MRLLKQSTAYDLMVFMTDSSDHVTGKTGLTLTITESKAAGALGSTSPTVTERSSGWYKVALTGTNTDTLGEYVLHITGTGCDPTDLVMQIFTQTTSDLASQTSVNTIDDFLDTEIAAILAAVDTEIGTLQTSINTIDDFLDTEVAAILAAVDTEIATIITNLATVDTVVDAIKAKTDSLTFTVAGMVDANIQAVNDTTVTGNGGVGTEWGP